MKSLIILLFLASCSSTFIKDETVELNSVPKAAVLLMVDNAQPVILGRTPIRINHTALVDRNNSSTNVRLKFSVPGFADEWVYFDAKNTVGKINLKMKPVEWWNDRTNISSSRIAQQIGSSIQEANRLIRKGQISEAKRDMEKLQKQYPYAPIFYDVLGSLSVLENKKEDAIKYYEQSLKLGPSNKETAETLDKLKKGRQ